MKKRWIALVVLAAMVLSLCVACSSQKKLLTDEEAQKIAVEAAGLTVEQVSDLHTHFNVADGTPQFQIHFDYGGEEYEYLIHGRTGEVLSANR